MRRKALFLLFLLGLGGIFLGIRYINLLQAKAGLELQLGETKRQVGFLEGRLKEEKGLGQKLNEEKESLAENLKQAQGTIAQLNQKNVQAQEHIFSLVKEVQVLEDKNLKVKEELTQLKEELNSLEAKDLQLEARLHSIPELRKAIKEVRRELPKAPLRPKPGPVIKKDRVYKFFNDENLGGNSGFIVKDGIPTYKARVKIEVRPLL